MEIGELRRIAAREEMSLNYIAKDEMISKALFNLQGFDNLILKGGTAINRVYLKNKRFSEDIDLDLVFDGTAKQALMKTNEAAKKLEGFEAAKPRIMNETIRYDIFYINPLEHKDRIRIEFRPARQAKNYSKKIVNFGFVPCDSSLLNVYSVEELIMQKIECMLGRIEGKDFFDIYHLIELPHKHLSLLREKKDRIIQRISMEGGNLKSMANTINHYIPKSNRPSWGIFLEELREKIRKY